MNQSKLYFKMRGKIYGIGERDITKNKVEDDKKIQLRFRLKSSNDNAHFCQITQWKSMVGKDVYLSKKVDNDFKTSKLSWDMRHTEMQDGWEMMGVKMKAPQDESTKTLVPMDAIDYILANFKDGDDIFIQGQATAFNGHMNYEVDKLYPTTNKIDFDAEDFEEVAEITGSLVYNSAMKSGDDMLVDTYFIDYKKQAQELKLIITGDDKQFQNALMNIMEFGEEFKGDFIIHNRVKYKETAEEVQENNSTMLLGKRAKSFEQNNSYQKREIESEFKHIELVGISEKTGNKYTVEELTEQSNVEQQAKEKKQVMPWEQ